MQKLALLFPAGTIAFEQVREAVLDVARYDVFNLGEALLEGDVLHLARMMDGLRGEGVAPPLVLWAIAEEIRAIGRVLDGDRRGQDAAAAVARRQGVGQLPPEPRCSGIAGASRKEQVEAAIAHAARVDRMVKGLIRGDVWDELLQLGAAFCRAAPRPSPCRNRVKWPLPRAQRNGISRAVLTRSSRRSCRTSAHDKLAVQPPANRGRILWTSEPTYTASAGRRARPRASSRKADTATKNRALKEMAAAIGRDAQAPARGQRARSRGGEASRSSMRR